MLAFETEIRFQDRTYGHSYKNQLAYYTEKINSKTEWKFAGVYADEGITGTSMKHREDFKRMLRACREGRIDLILCKSVSRFGRNSVDVLRTIRALRERGIGVLFEKEAVDTRTMNSELILAFHSAFSQSESESISGNVRWGLRKAYENGTISIGPNLYGFRKGQDGGVEIDEEKATVIRQIARWFLDGDSLHAIADKLAQRHIPSPKGKDTWSTATLRSLLTNEKYKGDALLQKTYHPSLFSDRAVQNDGDLPKYYLERNHMTQKQFVVGLIEAELEQDETQYQASHPEEQEDKEESDDQVEDEEMEEEIQDEFAPQEAQEGPGTELEEQSAADQNPAPVDDFEAGSEEVSQEDDGAEETGEEEAQETEEVFEDSEVLESDSLDDVEEVEDIELEETGEDTLEDEESQEDEEAWEESNDQEDAQDEEEEQSFQPSMAW